MFQLFNGNAINHIYIKFEITYPYCIIIVIIAKAVL